MRQLSYTADLPEHLFPYTKTPRLMSLKLVIDDIQLFL